MSPSVTLALVNGRVRTLDPGAPEATAVAVAGEEIVAVGDDTTVRDLSLIHI